MRKTTCVGVVLGVAMLGGAQRYAGAKKPKPSAPAPVAPRQSFQALLDQAEPVTDLARLVDPLFDTCDASDPLAYRQCEGEREFLETDARKKLYVATGGPAALAVSPYDASQKAIDFDIQGCLACLNPLKLSDGKGGTVERFVTTRPPRAVKNGRAVGVDVGTLQLAFDSKEKESDWKKHEKRTVPRLRTQFVFKLGQTWSSGGFSGVSFVPLAYRVVVACTGDVLATSPQPEGGKAERAEAPLLLQLGDALVCPAPGEDLTPEERASRDATAHLPQFLSRELIEKGLQSAQPRIRKCHEEYDESGMVGVRMVLDGATGKAREVEITPPFDTTPGGLCVRSVVKATAFSRFTSEKQEIKVSLPLR